MSARAHGVRRRVAWLVAVAIAAALALLWWRGGEAVFLAALIAPLC